jgi:hypothetical protein
MPFPAHMSATPGQRATNVADIATRGGLPRMNRPTKSPHPAGQSGAVR